MPRRSIEFLILAAALVTAILPTTALAATEVGNECAAERQTGDFVEVPDALASGGFLPLKVPGNGVLTSWRIRSLSPTPGLARVGVFREADGSLKFQLIAESGEETAVFGPNTFPARIPVKAGDRFGSIPAGGGFFSCVTGNPDDHSPSYKGVVSVGGTYQFLSNVTTQVPIVGVVEPDIDGDGFGDETQDGCTRSPATTIPCPPVTTTVEMKPGKKAIVVEVKVSSLSKVQVFGQVSWQVRGKPKTSAKTHGLIVGLTGGAPRQLTVGPAEKFRVRFPKPIKRRLGRITPKQALTAKMTVRTTDLAGTVTEQHRKVKLKGQKGS